MRYQVRRSAELERFCILLNGTITSIQRSALAFWVIRSLSEVTKIEHECCPLTPLHHAKDPGCLFTLTRIFACPPSCLEVTAITLNLIEMSPW